MNLIKQFFFQLLYLRQPPWDTGITPPELMDFIQNHHAGRALDLGCGTGTNAITLAQHDWQVIGVDFVRRAIKKARVKAHHAGVDIEFRVSNVTHLHDISDPFDLILDIGCYHALSDRDKLEYIDNLERLLATTGTFMIYAYFRSGEESPNALGGGIIEADVSVLQEHLTLIKREDGSERGIRQSAWFWFQR